MNSFEDKSGLKKKKEKKKGPGPNFLVNNKRVVFQRFDIA